jgi:hypothetical protein
MGRFVVGGKAQTADSPRYQPLAVGSEKALRRWISEVWLFHEVCDTRFMAAQERTVEE